MTDALDDLLPFYWRDVEVPIQELKFSIAHDLVEHKPWGVNGARVEDTGLAPVRLTATIPFVNNLVPGKNEGWLAGELYPVVFREFVLAFQDKKTGLLQHPEFGKIACKPETFDCTLTGAIRSGVIVQASFIETLDDEVRHEVRNPLIELDVEAASFDTSNADLLKIVPKLPQYQETFADLARKIAAVGDQVALLEYRAAGRIKSIVYRAEKVQQSIERARTALTWPATQNVERIKSNAHDLEQKLLKARRRIRFYVVPSDTTLAGLLPKLAGATLADVMKLNPDLVANPVVPARAIVRFYQAA